MKNEDLEIIELKDKKDKKHKKNKNKKNKKVSDDSSEGSNKSGEKKHKKSEHKKEEKTNKMVYNDRFEIQTSMLLGRGSFGEIYITYDLMTRNYCALKLVIICKLSRNHKKINIHN